MKRITIIIIAVIAVSCRNTPVNLNGIWIPEKINWQEGSFHTIYIYNDTNFIRFASTQTKNDSIEFMTGEGFVLEYGHLQRDSDKEVPVSFNVLHRSVRIVGEELPGILVNDTLKLIENTPEKKSLKLGNETYNKTNIYTYESKQRMIALAKNLVPELLKEYNLPR